MKLGYLMRRFALLCFVAGLFGMAAPAVHAEGTDLRPGVAGLKNIKTIPTFPMDKAAFENATELHTATPLGDKFLEYSVRLPKDWKKSQERVSASSDGQRRLLGEVARYFGPSQGDVRSRFVVMAVELDREISVRNWFLHYILSHGYTLTGIKEVSDRRVEALYIQLEKDTSYVVRAVAEVNGPRMILSMMYIPERLWRGQEAVQEAVVNSFTLVSPEDKPIENVRTHAFLDLVRFDYPVSWTLRAPNIQSLDAMEAKLVSVAENKSLNGEIDVNLISTELDTTLVQEVNALRKALDARGMVIGDMIEQPTNYKFSPHIYYDRVEVYEITNKDKTLVDHEYWIAVLIEDRYYTIVTMLSPSRDVDFYTWASNTEAFERVIKTIRP